VQLYSFPYVPVEITVLKKVPAIIFSLGNSISNSYFHENRGKPILRRKCKYSCGNLREFLP
jgi:hypothetical protein